MSKKKPQDQASSTATSDGISFDFKEIALEHRLILRDAALLKVDFSGKIIAINESGFLVKISNRIAVQYRRENIEINNISIGQDIQMQYDRATGHSINDPSKVQDREIDRNREMGFN